MFTMTFNGVASYRCTWTFLKRRSCYVAVLVQLNMKVYDGGMQDGLVLIVLFYMRRNCEIIYALENHLIG